MARCPRGVAAAILMFAALALPAKAQPAHPDATAACLALMDGTPFTAGGADALPDGGCRFRLVRFGFGADSRFAYEASSMEEHGFTSTAQLLMPGHPAHVRVEWHDVAFALRSGNAVADWISRQQQVPFDLVVDFRLDAGGDVTLSEFSLSGASFGHTTLSGVGHIPLGGSPTNAGIARLTLHMDSRRLIAAFLLSPLTQVLPPQDPAAAVAAYQAQAEDALRMFLPQAGASPGTVDALIRFVADFPHPTQVLDLDITADPPLDQARATGGAQDLPLLLKSLSVTATYQAEAH